MAKKIITQKYVIVTKACEGVNFRRFAFDAKNEEEAKDKAFGWARYQGYDVREVWAELAVNDELNWASQNDWVR